MKCPDCGARTRVVNTRPQKDGIRRQHACSCGFGAYSAEVWLRSPMPPQKSLYTAAEVAAVQKSRVNIRRKNEDRRNNEQA